MTLSRKLPLCKTLHVNDICMFLSSDLHVFKRFFALSGCEDGSEGSKPLWNVCLTPLSINQDGHFDMSYLLSYSALSLILLLKEYWIFFSNIIPVVIGNDSKHSFLMFKTLTLFVLLP